MTTVGDGYFKGGILNMICSNKHASYTVLKSVHGNTDISFKGGK